MARPPCKRPSGRLTPKNRRSPTRTSTRIRVSRTTISTDSAKPSCCSTCCRAAPEFRPDFLAWEPMSYREHFRLSHFKTRDVAIAAYDRADPDIRNSLDTLAVTMTIVLEATRAAMEDADRRPETIAALAGNAIDWLKPLIARAGALINGESNEKNTLTPQALVDRLMKR